MKRTDELEEAIEELLEAYGNMIDVTGYPLCANFLELRRKLPPGKLSAANSEFLLIAYMAGAQFILTLAAKKDRKQLDKVMKEMTDWNRHRAMHGPVAGSA